LVQGHQPLLLLDIDGTLCPEGPGPDRAVTWLAGGAGQKYFRSDLPDVLGALRERYQLVWATAWEHHANLILAPALGLPWLPVIAFTNPAPGQVGPEWRGRTWKLPSVERFAGERSLAWVDDDVHADAFAWAALRRFPTKLIRTDGRIGLTDDHIRSLLAFAAR
jgi:hypothetical protein